MSLVASQVMDSVATLMNDTQKQRYTYPAITPYLNLALADLREIFKLNNIPVTNNMEMGFKVSAANGTYPVVIQYSALASDFVDARKLSERTWGNIGDDFVPMTKLEVAPPFVVQTSFLTYWWKSQQQLNFVGATSDIELRIDYVSEVLPAIVNPTDMINVIGVQSYLQYRTARHCSFYIAENPTRAQQLDGDANAALEKSLGINIKGSQAIAIRRRPFQAGLRSRNYP